VENTTPYTVEIATAIENETDWASPDNRPDKNLNAVGNKPLVLERFSAVRHLREDVSGAASSANFSVAIKIRYAEGKPDEIAMSVNQCEARNRPAFPEPAESAEVADENAIPHSRTCKLTGSSAGKYVIIQHFPDVAGGKYEHVFLICENREGV
jgi:hypothetical protein